MRNAFLAVIAVALFTHGIVAGQQIICPDCPPDQFYCPPIQDPGQWPVQPEAAVDGWYTKFTGSDRQPGSATAEEKALAALVRASCRAYQGNGCGTATLNGRDSEYIYLMTNAHVASTKIGSTTKLQAAGSGVMEQFAATVIEAGYSSQYRTDWALLRASAEYMKTITPIRLSMEMPDPNAPTITWGHPKCLPTEGHACKTVQFRTVWLWNPDSIGGQSGSAVVQLQEGTPVQKGLLSWSEGGYGSGQFTATIYKQSTERTVRGELRTGNEELPKANTAGGVELVEGYNDFELREGWSCLGDAREVALRDYPIWHTAGPVDPPPVDPPTDPECPPMSPDVRSRLETIQKALDEVLGIK